MVEFEDVNPAEYLIERAWVAYDKAMNKWITANDYTPAPSPPRLPRLSQQKDQ